MKEKAELDDRFRFRELQQKLFGSVPYRALLENVPREYGNQRPEHESAEEHSDEH